MEITIDQNSGFCFGVVHAIEAVEKSLHNQGQLYCLGDIVHNSEEVSRLKKMGMKVIDKETMKTLYNQNILIRAHGEPPSTYQLAKENNLSIIDATCTVVLKLQKSVRKGFLEMKQKNGQVILFGKKGHAEVIGLTGQTENTAIVISELEEIDVVDFSKPSRLYAQTTQSLSTFKSLVELIKQKYIEQGYEDADFIWYDTVCRQVSNREYSLKQFAYEHDVIIFVSGEKSSNGLVLFQICQSVNKHSHMISSANDLQKEWFINCRKTGVCGATSTPMWLMNNIAEKIKIITLH
ncbi:MAG: 4-hydroxy-3-methylbut-2-enyl diphosphate reductase [Bacteroidales bacterium]|jgi:4-hydroxy-3-methylbut-2-enyl diphosphate reductase|nr:4-hydroxy-3-methylbut-2-enyl diphosphate reductase [Bacteroidales bacterium]